MAAIMLPNGKGLEKIWSILLVASALHVFATCTAHFALGLLAMTESNPDALAITAMVRILQGLAMPVAWPVERFLDPSGYQPPPFGVRAVLRLLNSLIVGALIAWAWTSIRRRHSADPTRPKRREDGSA